MIDRIDLKLIGERIKAVREKKGYTQAELGASLGIEIEDIDQIEQGQGLLTLQDLFNLSNFLEQPALYFLGFEPDEISLLELYRALPAGLPRNYLLKYVQSWVGSSREKLDG